MQVKEAIEYLTKYNKLDDHIMIGWKAIEDLNGDELCPMPNLTIDVWNEACARADRNEYLFAFSYLKKVTITIRSKHHYNVSFVWAGFFPNI